MATRVPDQRPRELRRRVVLPARMRADSGWCDARILNISSRGMMIDVGRGAPRADTIELRRGTHVILARVVWRDGSRAGLHCEDRLPVEEILSLSQAPALQLTAAPGFTERRTQPRRQHDQSRSQGRIAEFASVGVIAASLALTLFGIVEQALAAPMDAIRAALGG
jgi:hypothetical protein